MKILRTASIGSNFTGSYKKWCSISGKVAYEGVAEAFVKLSAQSIKFYTIHSIITFKEHGCLKKVIHQIDKKMNGCYFQQVLRQNLSWFF